MKLYDIIILITLILFAFVGFKRGFFKSLVIFIGVILVLVLSYNLKNYLGDFLTLNMPFIKFGNAITLNVIMYQAIAFLLMLIVFSLIYRIIVTITGIFEKILKMTIILGIPSKLLGMLFGFLEGVIFVYIVLFFLAQPFLNINISNDSIYANTILTKTPIISSYMEKPIEIFNEIKDVIETKDDDNIDLKITDLILKNNITSYEIMQKLVDSGKISDEGISDVINKYK